MKTKTNRNKILVLLVAVVMLFTLSVPVFATETTYEAKIGDKSYETLQEAFDAAVDGDTITLLSDVTYTKDNAQASGSWLDGLVYTGDQSFTVDLNGYTITEDGDLNDYLIYLKNMGEKANEITFVNGTIAGGAYLWNVICIGTSSANYPTTVNLGKGLTVTADGSENSGEDGAIKARSGCSVNVLEGATIISEDALYCVQAGTYSNDTTSTVTVYAGATITQKKESGAAVSGTANIKILGGTITSENGSAVYTCTSGTPQITVSGGTITARDYAVAAASDLSSFADAGASATITGGTISGDVAALTYSNDTSANDVSVAISGDATITGDVSVAGGTSVTISGGTVSGSLTVADTADVAISGGTFETATNVADYLEPGVKVKDNSVVVLEAGDYKTLESSENAVAIEADMILEGDVTLTKGFTISGKTLVIDLGGSAVSTLALDDETSSNGYTLKVLADSMIKNGSNVLIRNGTIDITGAHATGNAVFQICDTSTVTLENVKLVGDGYSSAYSVFYLTGWDGGTLNIKNSTVELANEQFPSGGVFKVECEDKSDINIVNSTVSLTNAGIAFVNGTVNMDSVILDITGGKNAINGSVLTVKNSELTISNCDGRALTLSHGDAVIENSKLTFSGATEGEIRFKDNATLSADEKSTITNDKGEACIVYADKGVTNASVNDTPVLALSEDYDTDSTDGKAALKAAASTVTVSKGETTVTLSAADQDKYVASIGSVGYEDINTALTSVQAGETIVIYAGDYEITCGTRGLYNYSDTVYGQRVTLPENVTIIGEGEVTITSAPVIQAEKFTIKNVDFVNDYYVAMQIQGNGTFEDCTFIGPNGTYASMVTNERTLTFKNCVVTGEVYGLQVAEGDGSVVIDGCTITGWNSYGVTGTVTIKNTKFYSSEWYGQLRFYQDAVVEDCVFEADMSIDADTTAKNPTPEISFKNCTVEDGSDFADLIDNDNVKIDFVVDGDLLGVVAKIGDTEYKVFADAVSAAESGDTIILYEGEYSLANVTLTKHLTFKAAEGTDKTKVVIDLGETSQSGSSFSVKVAFEGLTLVRTTTQKYAGFKHATSETYTNCVIKGQYFIYGDTATFTGCTFETEDAENYNIWCYGSDVVTFDTCVFNCAGKSVLVYNDAQQPGAEIVVTDCTFNASKAATGKAAIEIDSTLLAANTYYTIEITDSEAIGFGTGTNSGDTLWNNKTNGNGTKSVMNAVTVDGELVLEAGVAKIGETRYATLQAALNAAAAMSGNVTVEIVDDIDLAGVTWNPVTVSAPGYPLVTVNGNGHTISHLSDMLFAGTWAGKSGLIINNLTIADSTIVHDAEDATETVGVGAFIGYPQASETITLSNCHLVDSTVSGGHWTGGLIGMAGGYSGSDGPVFMTVTITDCSVTGSTITGKGSVGGVIGHGSCDAWTDVVITNTIVTGNTITSTGDSNVKAGTVMGTIGAAGQPTEVNGTTLTGGMEIAVVENGNTVTSNGTKITTAYGRQGSGTGILTIAGGNYENNPVGEGHDFASAKEGYIIVQASDGTYGVTIDPEGELAEDIVATIGNFNYATLEEAIAAAKDGETIKLLDDVDLTETQTLDKAITLDLGDKIVTSTDRKAFEVYADVTIMNGTIIGAERAVDTRKAVTLTLDSVELTATGEGEDLYTQPLTIGGYENGTVVNIKDSTINAGSTGYAIISFVETKLNVVDSEITGYAAIYMKEGSANSVVKVSGSILVGTYEDTEKYDFGTIVFEDKDIQVYVDEDSAVWAMNTHAINFSNHKDNEEDEDIETSANTVVIAGLVEAQKMIAGFGENSVVAFNAEYADKLVGEGYLVVHDSESGLVGVYNLASDLHVEIDPDNKNYSLIYDYKLADKVNSLDIKIDLTALDNIIATRELNKDDIKSYIPDFLLADSATSALIDALEEYDLLNYETLCALFTQELVSNAGLTEDALNGNADLGAAMKTLLKNVALSIDDITVNGQKIYFDNGFDKSLSINNAVTALKSALENIRDWDKAGTPAISMDVEVKFNNNKTVAYNLTVTFEGEKANVAKLVDQLDKLIDVSLTDGNKLTVSVKDDETARTAALLNKILATGRLTNAEKKQILSGSVSEMLSAIESMNLESETADDARNLVLELLRAIVDNATYGGDKVADMSIMKFYKSGKITLDGNVTVNVANVVDEMLALVNDMLGTSVNLNISSLIDGETKTLALDLTVSMTDVYSITYMNGTTVLYTTLLPVGADLASFEALVGLTDKQGEDGWNTKADATGTSYTEMPASDLVLYAAKKTSGGDTPTPTPGGSSSSVTTYTVTFVADGTRIMIVTYKAGQKELSYIPEVPAKEGYIGKWEDFELCDKNIIVNAIYTPATKLIATFVADGVVVAEIPFYAGDTKLSSTPSVPAKTGYSGKWESYKLGNTDITINAIYTAKTYTVNFRSNGGKGTMGLQTLTYDKAEALTANAFTRDGYTFAGWNTKADGTGTSYVDGQSVKNLSTGGDTIMLYAQWKKVEETTTTPSVTTKDPEVTTEPTVTTTEPEVTTTEPTQPTDPVVDPVEPKTGSKTGVIVAVIIIVVIVTAGVACGAVLFVKKKH